MITEAVLCINRRMVKTGVFKRHDVLREIGSTSDNEFPKGLSDPINVEAISGRSL